MAYTKIRAVTIKAGQVPTTQTNCPLLFSFTDNGFKDTSNGGFNRPDAADIDLFSDIGLGAGSLVKAHKLFYDGATGQIIMLGKGGSVFDGAVWYFGMGDAGKSASSDDPANVWDANFKGSWPMTPQTGALTARNLVTSSNATVSGAVSAAGPIYGAALLNGSTDNITTDLTAQVPPVQTTIEVWTYRTGHANAAPRIFHLAGAMGQLYSGATTLNWLVTWSGGQGSWAIASPSDNAWHHLVLTYDAGNIANDPIFYLDGVVQTLTLDTNPASGTYTQTPAQAYIGNTENSNRAWQGRLAALRYSDTVRSADYVTVQFRTQGDPASFWTLGSVLNFPIVSDLSTLLYDPVVGSSRF